MAALLTILEEIIHPDFRLRPAGHWIKILETQSGAANQGVSIQNTLKSVAFSLDAARPKGAGAVFPFFHAEASGFQSRNDATIFCRCEDTGRNLVFLIELKSTKEGEALKQMRSGAAFARWVVELAKLHRSCNEDIECRGVLFMARKKAAAQPTRRTPIEFFRV